MRNFCGTHFFEKVFSNLVKHEKNEKLLKMANINQSDCDLRANKRVLVG